MIILGIDPGIEKSAVVVWESAAEYLLTLRIMDNELLANALVFPFILFGNIDVVVCEMVASYGMAVGKTVFETVYWIGRFAQAVSFTNSYKFKRVFRKDIKLHFCNSLRAKDTNIRQALIDRFGEPGTKKKPGILYGLKKDLWSAMAVAVYYADIITSSMD